ncbi:hypothetical protein [Pseudomonas cedrina]|uniref:hypothetical protein n=1 Tax=Pseudomonas cedrina TaxID=651740 RepID=UPI00278ACBFD|nr:hypothetical protein [Pseudomonas cedrina]MDQ0654381.1 hypothetical protein [Pseudomonas cedrina]
MSSSNIVVIVTIVVAAISTGYVTYSTNQTTREIEKLKQEHLLSLQEIKTNQSKEQSITAKNQELRSQYCTESKALHKEFIKAIMDSRSDIPPVREAAEAKKTELKLEAVAYLDDGVFNQYIKGSNGSDKSDDTALVAALSTQIRNCAEVKKSK